MAVKPEVTVHDRESKDLQTFSFPALISRVVFKNNCGGVTNEGQTIQIHPLSLIGYTKENISNCWQGQNLL
jgi:hypothetical protein